MTAFKTKAFARFARKARLGDDSLIAAAMEVAAGKFDADLGGYVFKQRIARPGGGKSGGFRTILLFRMGGHCFFAHGFAKSGKANVTARELAALKKLAALLLGFSEAELDVAVAAGELMKVNDDAGKAKQG